MLETLTKAQLLTAQQATTVAVTQTLACACVRSSKPFCGVVARACVDFWCAQLKCAHREWHSGCLRRLKRARGKAWQGLPRPHRASAGPGRASPGPGRPEASPGVVRVWQDQGFIFINGIGRVAGGCCMPVLRNVLVADARGGMGAAELLHPSVVRVPAKWDR